MHTQELQNNTRIQHVVIATFFIIVTVLTVVAVQQMCEFSVATTLSLMLSASAFICVLSMREYQAQHTMLDVYETQDVILTNVTPSAWYLHCTRMNYEIQPQDLHCLVAVHNGEPVGALREYENWLLMGEGEILISE